MKQLYLFLIIFSSLISCKKKDDFGFDSTTNKAIDLQVNAQATLYSIVLLHDFLRTQAPFTGINDCFVRNTDTTSGTITDLVTFASQGSCFAIDAGHTTGTFSATYTTIETDTVFIDLSGITSLAYEYNGVLKYVSSGPNTNRQYTILVDNMQVEIDGEASFLDILWNLQETSNNTVMEMITGYMKSSGAVNFEWNVSEKLGGTSIENGYYSLYDLTFYQGRADLEVINEIYSMRYGEGNADNFILIQDKNQMRQGIYQKKI